MMTEVTPDRKTPKVKEEITPQLKTEKHIINNFAEYTPNKQLPQLHINQQMIKQPIMQEVYEYD